MQGPAVPRIGLDLGGSKLLLLAEWQGQRRQHTLPTGKAFTGGDLTDAVRAFLDRLPAAPGGFRFLRLPGDLDQRR